MRQQERLREHEAALLRLSTPLIPIGDDILVMPLIGRLDAALLEHAQDILLKGSPLHARVAIVDVTGVAELDEAAAAGLLKVAQAVRLLGARVVLTGIRPGVAAALASSATAWTDVTVRASLKRPSPRPPATPAAGPDHLRRRIGRPRQSVLRDSP
ncbi:STAS domain-containing protein [Nannocystis pusilla]|uniref:STAS domain-containing protein n=1 Tax=Nannocystis pusilla TaxID=889268 RepID=UPI003B7D2E77